LKGKETKDIRTREDHPMPWGRWRETIITEAVKLTRTPPPTVPRVVGGLTGNARALDRKLFRRKPEKNREPLDQQGVGVAGGFCVPVIRGPEGNICK